MNLRDTYNRIARDWHEDHRNDLWSVEPLNDFMGRLPESASVLDIGCAGGLKSKTLIGRGFRVTGIDFSENLIQIAKKEVPEGTFSCLDIKDLTKLQGSFDGILALAVLLHIPHKQIQTVLLGIVEKLKREGIMLIAVKERRPGQDVDEVKEENDYGYPYRRLFSYYTEEELKRMFENVGVDVLSSRRIKNGKTVWLLYILKKTYA